MAIYYILILFKVDTYSKLHWKEVFVETRHPKILDAVDLIPFRNSIGLLFTVYCLALK